LKEIGEILSFRSFVSGLFLALVSVFDGHLIEYRH